MSGQTIQSGKNMSSTNWAQAMKPDTAPGTPTAYRAYKGKLFVLTDNPLSIDVSDLIKKTRCLVLI
jgi:hypothetical protein